MATLFSFFYVVVVVIALASSSPFTTSTSSSDTLRAGHSLSVDKSDDVLVSANQVFSAGFHAVGDNLYCFAIWFSEPARPGRNKPKAVGEAVWMANRDLPVNGKRSRLRLLKSGALVVTDADQFTVWDINTFSKSPVSLRLNDYSNLLLESSDGVVLWQSFESHTDTLLPLQPLTRSTKLISCRSQANFSSGFYTLYFDNNNLLSLLFDNQNISSVYWPTPWLLSWDAGRSSYNSTRVAMLNFLGNFSSSDHLTFLSSDYGFMTQFRLKEFKSSFSISVSLSILMLKIIHV